jgi:hypothetical protein
MLTFGAVKPTFQILMMNKNQSSINTEPGKKNEAHFKFSLFNASSDVWILAIALLVLLVISFINEKETYPSSIRQSKNSSENIIPVEKLSGEINTAITEDKAVIVRINITDIRITKDLFGLG